MTADAPKSKLNPRISVQAAVSVIQEIQTKGEIHPNDLEVLKMLLDQALSILSTRRPIDLDYLDSQLVHPKQNDPGRRALLVAVLAEESKVLKGQLERIQRLKGMAHRYGVPTSEYP